LKLVLHKINLRLKNLWTVSRESFKTQEALIVELSHEGHRGYGEASAFMTSRYPSTVEDITRALKEVEPLLESYDFEEPETLWHLLNPLLSSNTFAQCALDVAAHDLWGKLVGQPVYRLWGLDPSKSPLTDYSIGIDSIKMMVHKLLEMPAWPIYKIKLGTAYDLEIIHELRAHTDAVFRVDANCGWTVEETLTKATALKEMNVEMIEQPLKAGEWEGMKQLYAACALPLMADESCCVAADVDLCHNHFHGVNIKLMKCGGMTPARRMITKARELGLEVMMGCMPESTVGVSAIAQLAPLLDYVDMDSPLLIENDIATGVRLEAGRIIYPNANGCGVELL
jgi:L-alanine-DL-glutamate epimerase-like enolase superfamily enzyme